MVAEANAASPRRRLRDALPHPFPFLFGAATVTGLVASNPDEGTVGANLVDPMIVALTVVVVSWAAAAIFTRDRLKRSLAATSISLPLLLSGYICAWLRDLHLGVGRGAALELGLVVVVIATLLVGIGRIRWVPETSRFFNLFAVFTVVLTVPATVKAVRGGRLPEPVRATTLPDTAGLHRPTIYLVILDGYSGAESLKENYGFDNEPFLDSLRTRGFGVPTGSRSNYVKTFLSLGSMLNREYLNELAEAAAPEYRERGMAYEVMEFNRTARDLKRLGYRFYYAGSSYPPLASNRLADSQFSAKPSTQFENLWYRTTALPPAIGLCLVAGLCRASDVPFEAESASETLRRVDYLHGLVRPEERRFIVAHWLLPHGPYRLDRDCKPRPVRWTVGLSGRVEDFAARELYIDQVVCTNALVLRLVDHIRDVSGDSAVIILQADHGNGRFPGDEPVPLEQATPDQVRERFDVFAAYAGPGALADSLGRQRTPVNVFRALFRVLWEVDEPPLEDRHYWSQGKQPLLLVPVDLQTEEPIPAVAASP